MPYSIARMTRPAKRDLVAVRGDTLEVKFTLRTPSQERVILTGWQGRAVARKAVDHPVLYEFEVEVDQTGAGSATAGEILVRAPWTSTTTFPQGGVWALSLEAGDVRRTVIAGNLTTERDVR